MTSEQPLLQLSSVLVTMCTGNGKTKQIFDKFGKYDWLTQISQMKNMQVPFALNYLGNLQVTL